jgi:Ca2+-binding EF-hand superfamily protein
MKKTWIIAALLMLAVGAPSAFAKKPKGEKKAEADVFARYDKNTDGKLDAEEIEMLKKAFASDPDLKKFDTNSDGKLDDNEIAAIKPAEHKKKKKKNA